MKMKCLFNSMLRGEVVKRGAILDLTTAEAELDVVKRFFVKVEDAGGETPAPDTPPAPERKPAAAKASGSAVAGLTRDQAIMKLAQAGVRVKANITPDALENLYNQTFANIAEAAEAAN